jgi:hypothetical protein
MLPFIYSYHRATHQHAIMGLLANWLGSTLKSARRCLALSASIRSILILACFALSIYWFINKISARGPGINLSRQKTEDEKNHRLLNHLLKFCLLVIRILSNERDHHWEVFFWIILV